MLAAHCRLERRQAIIEIGIQPFPVTISGVSPDPAAPQLSIACYRALIDTGAQRTCLTDRTIAIEGLVRHGHKPIRNVHNEVTHSLFMAQIGIWGTNPSRSYFGLEEPIEVINIADNRNFDAILGMDLLERFSFSFDRTGHFELVLA